MLSLLQRFALLSLALFASIALVACGDDDDDDADPAAATATTSEESSFPITVTRSDGEELVIEEPPQRIVSLSASDTEIFYAIGAGDQVVAADLFSTYPEEAAEKATLDSFSPSPEAILAEEPDLVLVFTNVADIVPTLDDLGAQVLYLEVPETIDGIFERIELFGDITGHPQEAQELVESMVERINAVTEVVIDVEEGPRVFHELDNLYFTVGSDSFIGQVYENLGAQNIAADSVEAFPQLTSEAVIAADPEVIILADEAAGESIETVQARPGWEGISAVREGRVHGVDPDIASRPGPRIVEFIEIVAGFLYPEFFD
jgi:cobalamin transport system substrate-binding protein